jgi:hypothetical protein
LEKKALVAKAEIANLDLSDWSHLIVSRNRLLEDSLQALFDCPTHRLRVERIKVRFLNEDGIDAGGLSKDWFDAVAKALVRDSAGLLFVDEDTNFVSIDERCHNFHTEEEIRYFLLQKRLLNTSRYFIGGYSRRSVYFLQKRL